MELLLIISSIALLLLLLIDYKQTLRIGDPGGAEYETNPILGKYPSDSKITIYFAICAVLLPLVGVLLVKFITPIVGLLWVVGWSILEIVTIIKNKNIGLGLL
jgi:hypothetical protein